LSIITRNCHYLKFTSFVEGVLVGRANHDSINEKAVAVTDIGCVACDFFLRIGAWQDVHAYVDANNVKITEHWNQEYNILSTTGRQSAYYSIANLMGFRTHIRLRMAETAIVLYVMLVHHLFAAKLRLLKHYSLLKWLGSLYRLLP